MAADDGFNSGSADLQPALVTIKQAALMLSLGRSTVYELIADGRLEVVHVGRSVRVPVEALAALVARLRAERTVSASS
jgi:excisionase family DNA binding protein